MVEKLRGESPAFEIASVSLDPVGTTQRTKRKRADGYERTETNAPELGSSVASAGIDPTDRSDAPVRGAQLGTRRWETGALFVSSSTIREAINTLAIDPMLGMVAKVAYSPDGPLGHSGMFSELGPFGNNPWHPSYWINLVTRMNQPFARMIAKNPFSPIKDFGALGEDGPTNRRLFEALLRPWLGGYASELEAGGVLGGLGNASVIGAGSIAGPAGALGGNGDVEDQGGNLRDEKGHVERSISVGHHDVELSRILPEGIAEHMKDNDTAWGVLHELKKVGDTSGSIPFTSHKDQWVTLAVVPRRPGDVFEIVLEDKKGRTIETVGESTMDNLMQFQVPKDKELRVAVRLKSSRPLWSALMFDPIALYVRAALMPLAMYEDASHPNSHPYFLICAGSGSLEGSHRPGPHQKRLDWTQFS
jgi:hypothetical protein